MPFIIKSVVNGMVLDVKNADKKNGAEVILWPYSGSQNQLWEYKNNMIYSKLSGQVSCCNLMSLSQSMRSSGVHTHSVHVFLLGYTCQFVWMKNLRS